MAVLETVLTTAGGAVSATVGVVVGVILSRRAQDRHWLRDQQLAAYQELMRQYATFVMTLKRAHADRSGWDCDWAVWSAALTSASLVAPAEVADEIDKFGSTIGTFLTKAAVNTTAQALSADEFAQAMLAPAAAQLSLVNAIRRSLDKDQGTLSTWLGWQSEAGVAAGCAGRPGQRAGAAAWAGGCGGGRPGWLGTRGGRARDR